MKKKAFRGNVVLPDRIIDRGVILIEKERIAGVYAHQSEIEDRGVEFIDYGETLIGPGLIDLHLHGALGKDVMDCREESLRQIALHQARCGVTGFLATTVSASLESILEAVEIIQKTIKSQFDQQLPSEILGVYIEGPFLSKQQKGAQDPDSIKEMGEIDVDHLIKAVHDLKAIISLAPEVDDNLRYIPRLKKHGFIVAVGHSNATYEQALEGFDKGICHATHLFNAMSGFDHREPGVVGAVLDSDDVSAELIADGIHVHPAALRLTVARKSTDKLCLVTDSLKAAGAGDGTYRWGKMEIEVRGPRATMKNTDVLAGSVLSLNQAVKNMIDWTGISVNQAINMASLNPARVLGLEEEIGSIQTGKMANLTIFDKEFVVLETVLRGKTVFKQ
ncbi:MAG: N-acetylglucosamine-6-phosphate deacetylase [Candidatus Aminicenantes bacterium]|nr:N-acetylglucosamine-6-phosphate deacetylase [Candidatus Aminicenantes bacterium]MDH5385294.1 N-acetylglucosamine-6-phosphate deacetylase [Candidatus Aminicenantes bacterium]MDH5742613.1 N-acetylglucosamine-6-phosphate deacetylase [Candidatus Aminicenantes bacterium]